MKIIINADDFGISTNINNAILNAIKDGYVTSSTILAVGDKVDEAIEMTKNLPHQVSFGIHLALTDNLKSLSDAKLFSENNWRYNRLNIFQLRHIIKEFSLQVEKLQKNGIEITHIDTHHHIHRFPLVLLAVIYIGKKYKINKMRTQILCHNKKLFNKFYRKIHNRLLRLFKFITPNCYTDFVHFKNTDNYNSNQTIEIMCHPGSQYNDEKYFNKSFYSVFENYLINYKHL